MKKHLCTTCTILLMLCFLLTGCGGDKTAKYSKYIVGDWYVATYSSPLFNFFSDGTCNIGEPINAHWEIVDGNQLIITSGMYDRVDTWIIESLDKKKLTFSVGEKSLTLYRTYEEAEKAGLPEGLEEDTDDSNKEEEKKVSIKKIPVTYSECFFDGTAMIDYTYKDEYYTGFVDKTGKVLVQYNNGNLGNPNVNKLANGYALLNFLDASTDCAVLLDAAGNIVKEYDAAGNAIGEDEYFIISKTNKSIDNVDYIWTLYKADGTKLLTLHTKESAPTIEYLHDDLFKYRDDEGYQYFLASEKRVLADGEEVPEKRTNDNLREKMEKYSDLVKSPYSDESYYIFNDGSFAVHLKGKDERDYIAIYDPNGKLVTDPIECDTYGLLSNYENTDRVIVSLEDIGFKAYSSTGELSASFDRDAEMFGGYHDGVFVILPYEYGQNYAYYDSEGNLLFETVNASKAKDITQELMKIQEKHIVQ